MDDLSGKAKAGLQEELRDDQAKLVKIEAKRAAAAKAGQPTAKLDQRINRVREEIGGDTKALEGIQTGTAIIDTSDDLPGWLGGSLSEAAKNPELVAYKLKSNAYKFSWLIIPLSVPFVWLLFPFSRRWRLYDHTVFVTYSLCFMSLLVVAGLVLGAFGITGLAGLLWVLPPFHMYRQLKGAYGLGRWSAIWRTSLLTIFAMIVIALFSAVLVGVGTYD